MIPELKNKCHCGKNRCMVHRESKTPFYRKYLHIRSRCIFTWDKDYRNYGARGIKFEWTSYQDFKKDMYESYVKHVEKHGKKNTTIDRINVNGNYCKQNCRWATVKQQINNTRFNRIILYKNKKDTLSNWAGKYNLLPETLSYRLNRGLNIETALTMKVSHSNKYATII